MTAPHLISCRGCGYNIGKQSRNRKIAPRRCADCRRRLLGGYVGGSWVGASVALYRFEVRGMKQHNLLIATVFILCFAACHLVAEDMEIPSEGTAAPSPVLFVVFELPEDEPTPQNEIDRLILELLAAKEIKPAPLCSDAVFIRRVYLDATGTLPTVKEVKEFLRDEQPGKRARLIDALLERPEFIDYYSLKWGDALRIKAEFPINLWPNGAAVYSRWVRDSVRLNKPYDQFVRELLLGSGSNFRNPPSNFYRAVQTRDASSIAEAVALTFLGVRLESFSQEQREQLSLFFSRVSYKLSAEWKEEIVYWNDEPLANTEVTLPDGQKVTIGSHRDPREIFADWLVSPENRWFAKNGVNRIWCWLFGVGIVHEPDDFRDDNPPSHPALLDYLAGELVKSNYNLKEMYRLILNSRTYQQSSIARTRQPEAAKYFAIYPPHPIEAEVLSDMVRQMIGVQVGYASDVPEPYTHIPNWRRTILLSDGSVTSPFLETFGRPPRDTGLGSERGSRATASQRMFLINSADMTSWIEQSWRLRSAAGAAASADFAADKTVDRRKAMLNFYWLTILSRYPTDEEYAYMTGLLTQKGKNETTILQDLVWALLCSKEFQCKH